MQTIHEVVKSNYKYAYCLADSPHGEDVKKQVSITDTSEVEEQFSELLKLVSDPDLRERLDTAAGRISYAYEKLGFVEGFIAERSLACLI